MGNSVNTCCIESSYWPSGIYPRKWVDGKFVLVSHIMWEDNYGPVLEGMFVCHHCDNPRCVRLDHLFLGTPSDNVRDCVAKGRQKNTKKTHCPQGHPYSSENTYYTRVGSRECRICVIEQHRRYRARRRAQGLKVT